MAYRTTLIGAAGKMGTRISNSLRSVSQYDLRYVERPPEGEAAVRERGDQPTPLKRAVPDADFVILAVPDRAMAAVSSEVVPLMKTGAMLVCLDPAAPYAGLIPEREDIAVFVCHPSHPSVFNTEIDLEARFDFFGSGKAKQAIVCALMRGNESDYAAGDALAKAMWKPVLRSHRMTVEQMAILEPALSETVAATCLTVIREATDEAMRRGVPAEAARDFILGHIFVELGILFGETDFPLSDGALQAIEDAKLQLFQPDWRKVFEPEAIRSSVAAITCGHRINGRHNQEGQLVNPASPKEPV